MGRLGLAFRILFNGSTAKKVSEILSETKPGLPAAEAEKKTAAPSPVRPSRSEAVTLLAALQREARFVDFVQEPIDAYSDAQVGAAVREIHRGCRDVLGRMFAPTPIVDQDEGSVVEVADPSSGQYRLTGNVGQVNSAVSGQLVHHGWLAQKCDVPKWSGDDSSSSVIASAEVQVS